MAASTNGLPSLPRNSSEGSAAITVVKSVQLNFTFEELGRSPLTPLQQKNRCSLPRINKKQELLPGLLKQPGRVSNAARQWNISDPVNMHNTLQLNKIAQDGEPPTLRSEQLTEENKTRELRGIKMSFRKKVIEPLEPLSLPSSNFAPPLSSKRHQAKEPENEPEPVRKYMARKSTTVQQIAKHSLGKLAPLSIHCPSDPQGRVSLLPAAY